MKRVKPDGNEKRSMGRAQNPRPPPLPPPGRPRPSRTSESQQPCAVRGPAARAGGSELRGGSPTARAWSSESKPTPRPSRPSRQNLHESLGFGTTRSLWPPGRLASRLSSAGKGLRARAARPRLLQRLGVSGRRAARGPKRVLDQADLIKPAGNKVGDYIDAYIYIYEMCIGDFINQRLRTCLWGDGCRHCRSSPACTVTGTLNRRAAGPARPACPQPPEDFPRRRAPSVHRRLAHARPSPSPPRPSLAPSEPLLHPLRVSVTRAHRNSAFCAPSESRGSHALATASPPHRSLPEPGEPHTETASHKNACMH